MLKKIIFDIIANLIGTIYTIGEIKAIDKIYTRYESRFEKYPDRFMAILYLAAIILCLPYIVGYAVIKHKFIDKK